MIYNEYKVKFYTDFNKGTSPVLKFIQSLPNNHQTKILKYIEFLKVHNGVLDAPYSKHIKGKIRELRVDFGKNRYRIFYFIFIHKTIVILHGFPKHSDKTPRSEIITAESCLNNVINNPKLYV